MSTLASGTSGAVRPSKSTPGHKPRLTAKQTRDNEIKSATPGDEYADQIVTVDNKIYKLHGAITCTQSGYFRKVNDGIRRENRNEIPFPVPTVQCRSFDRVLRWLYSAGGVTTSDDLEEMKWILFGADFLEVPALMLQILETVASPEYRETFPKITSQDEFHFLNDAYSCLTGSSNPGFLELLDGLSTRLIKDMSVEILLELFVIGGINEDFEAQIRKRILGR
ncbi:hypothetical protein TWF481_003153 [Arthrobotrys musiformis]|uniref:BTB domain-containing protein n=1 Tax=Arthrobotrys musiformis TaxID=47236 RepID=A0AAV9VPE8_9PEZI